MARAKPLTFMGHELLRQHVYANENITVRAEVILDLGPRKGDRVSVRVYRRECGSSWAHCDVGVGGHRMEQVVNGVGDAQETLDELERVLFFRFRTQATLFDYELEKEDQ